MVFIEQPPPAPENQRDGKDQKHNNPDLSKLRGRRIFFKARFPAKKLIIFIAVLSVFIAAGIMLAYPRLVL